MNDIKVVHWSDDYCSSHHPCYSGTYVLKNGLKHGESIRKNCNCSGPLDIHEIYQDYNMGKLLCTREIFYKEIGEVSNKELSTIIESSEENIKFEGMTYVKRVVVK